MSGDSSQQQQQEIITVAHEGPHMSIDELLKVLREANGMPVLFVPSGDGRLAAVAVDGLQNLVPAAKESDENKQQDYRGWLLLVSSLVATVTFTAGLTPPGGFWADDDEAKGRVAGKSVMHDKFRDRYTWFYFFNTMAFFTALAIIGMLAANINNKKIAIVGHNGLICLVIVCFFGLGGSYVVGTWAGPRSVAGVFMVLAMDMVYMLFPLGTRVIQAILLKWSAYCC
ncbi:uncharacterized protein LOC112271750 [Brachypodium distachyon]|uniref:PGG domain-containing protein n=1 Tax=Brachypodium distachyon TaxID=15368 RepID=A0A0Q3FQI3_BRADI|nr:uncharacterized protein LOC112271750 [Brachypodium distachyon]KQK01398.1 hypothetical protein BRADI_3g55596v3 [Brachypodium distachyon]KQK01399.1 hypothetical protein BRADI_3g55596v3 [Brachypodium distachyon]PNT69444.1 hypothetical protein BRADI_3g55596v3 [Brachypodium distachyon]PNT69445.1 hypothetical protein BRADI_3g55596v3 [Brachypodium distachyon]|eukprot:XP_024317470.1 uncharacterized protein LOC112271750 [Brachypodium distachyon]